MADQRPIGVFDSGFGGLTVLKALREMLPGEQFIYFGDSGRAPYGTKSAETVATYTCQDVHFLETLGVKMVVIACNTASALGLGAAREKYSLPIVEVIGPGARAAIKATKTGRIGVIATPATIESSVYERAICDAGATLKPNLDISFYGKACPLFVPIVEEGWWDTKVARLTAQSYLTPLKKAGIDTLVMGCTHYPLLEGVIHASVGHKVTLVNSAREVANEVKIKLDELDLAASPNCDSPSDATLGFYTSDSPAKFAKFAGEILDMPLTAESVSKVAIEEY